MLYLSREDVEELLTYEDCVEVCEEALLLQGRGETDEVPRILMNTGTTQMRFMISMIKSKGLVGLRQYNVAGAPIRLMFILWDGRDGRPLAMLDAMWIRDIRTGSVGAIGAKYLARKDSQKIAVIGSGRQARSGLGAHAKVFKLTQCKLFSPNEEHRRAYAKEMSPVIGLEIEPVKSAEEAVRDADIVLTGTGVNTPSEPVFRGGWLRPGLHLSAIGGRAELDDATVTGASKVVIDSKAQFTYEAYDVTEQVKKGLLSWDQIAELHEVVAGDKPGRERDDEITLLKTVGTPLQDLLPAAKAYERALEKGRGKELGELFPPSGGWWGRVGDLSTTGPPLTQRG